MKINQGAKGLKRHCTELSNAESIVVSPDIQDSKDKKFNPKQRLVEFRKDSSSS